LVVQDPFARLSRLAASWVSQVSGDAPGAVTSQSGFSCGVGCHEKRRTLPPVTNRRTVTEGGVVARVLEVKDLLSNKPINPTPFAASRRLLSQASRRGSRAGYRPRWTDSKTIWVF